MSIINSEIQTLKSKKVNVNTEQRTGDYISGVFTRSNKDGSHGMILNLKNCNKFICYIQTFEDGVNTKCIKCD